MPQAPENQDWADFKEIKAKVSFETVLLRLGLLEKLQKVGDEWVGDCPFHKGSDKPTFHVNVTKGAFICFACKAKGNVIDFVSKLQGIGLRAAGVYLSQFLEGGSPQASAAADPGQELRGHVAALVSALVAKLERRLEKREEFVREVTDLVLGVVEKL